jgi:glutathione S-transferase
MKLYYNKFSRAGRVRWMLEEAGAPYELVPMEMDALASPEYRKVHPLGCLPGAEEDGQPLFESAALCMHIADAHPEKGLAPAPGTRERALYYQWIFFGMTELEPPIVEVFAQTQALPEAERSPKALEEARAEFAERAAILEKELATKPWLLGERFTAADTIVGSMLVWSGFMGLLADWPNLKAYTKRCGAREANKRARAD